MSIAIRAGGQPRVQVCPSLLSGFTIAWKHVSPALFLKLPQLPVQRTDTQVVSNTHKLTIWWKTQLYNFIFLLYRAAPSALDRGILSAGRSATAGRSSPRPSDCIVTEQTLPWEISGHVQYAHNTFKAALCVYLYIYI